MGGGVREGGEAVFAPSRPDVIDEVIDGEAVVVHLGTGRYFALNVAATEVWVWFGAGQTLEGLAGLDDVSAAWADAARTVVDAWIDEQLLVPAAAGAHPGIELRPTSDVPPDMRVFSDLEDLLLVDPIHDVVLDTDGFPVARPPS